MIKYVLEQLYTFEDARGTLDMSLDLIYKFLSAQLNEENFSECNTFMVELDITRVRPTLLINILAITIASKLSLPVWDAFLEKLRKHLTIKYGIAKAELLLRGIV